MGERLPTCKNCGRALRGVANDYAGPHWVHESSNGPAFTCENPTTPMPADDYLHRDEREVAATERFRGKGTARRATDG